jgi:signal transduction histidine kinase
MYWISRCRPTSSSIQTSTQACDGSAPIRRSCISLLNLCKNASDAMPLGGTLSITSRNLCARLGSSWVEIAIADDGFGMQPDVLSRMFEPYFTTKEPGKGTGLGLAEVKRFVQRSGGMIAAASAENLGTTIRMFFPCD